MDDFKKLIEQDKPTLVDFFATWCGPCQRMHPIIEEVKAAVGDSANVIKVDVDKNEALARRYKVMSIPTIYIFQSGYPVKRVVGLQAKESLIAELNARIAAGKATEADSIEKA